MNISNTPEKPMNTRELIEAAKSALREKGLADSDYRLAAEIGISRSEMSEYKSGKRTISDFAAARIADLLHKDRLDLIAMANAEREKDAEKAAYWRKIFTRASTAAVALIALNTGISDDYGKFFLDNNNIHYANLRIMMYGAL